VFGILVLKEMGQKMELLTKRMKSLFLAGALLAGVGMAGVSSALEIWDKAPDFTLPSTTGQKISLSDFRGKKLVLLEFYVADFGAT
jgi:hypothetical protein